MREAARHGLLERLTFRLDGRCDSCAAPDHPMIDHFWRERRPIGRISIAIGDPARRLLFAWSPRPGA